MVIVDHALFYERTEDLGMEGFRCLSFQGAVINIVRLHSEEKEVETCVYGINRCSDVTCTDVHITGFYNMIHSYHRIYQRFNTLSVGLTFF